MTRVPQTRLFHPILRGLQVHYSILNIFNHFTRLACYLVPAEDRNTWMHLVPFAREGSPIDFESYHGRGEERQRYNDEMFDRAASEKRTVCSRRSGFYDFFVPVMRGRQCLAFVVSGVALKEVPRREELVRQWVEWTGAPPSPGPGDFQLYVRRVLETPVLPPPVFEAHQEIMELLAKAVAGGGMQVRAISRVEKLKNSVFAQWLPHARWMSSVVGRPDRTTNIFWKNGRVSDWERVEIGIRRPPTTIMALAPLDSPGESPDETEVLLRARRIQMEAIRLAHRFPETVADKLGDFGVLFLVSPEPSKGAAAARAEMRERARHIATALRKSFGVRMVVGIGRSEASGQYLGPSHQDALAALQWCLFLQQDILFHDERPSRGPETRFSDIRTLSNQLVDALGRGHRLQLDLILDEYLRAVLWFSGRRPETVRLLLWSTIDDFRELASKRQPHTGPYWAERFMDLEHRFRETDSIPALFNRFREVLGELSLLSKKPAQGNREARWRWAVHYLQKHFREPLTQRNLAARVGLSPRVLGIGISRVAGVGFNDYLRKLRVEEARRLLAGGETGLAHIAQDCGFSSSSYLVRSFKKVYRMTPERLRLRVTGGRGGGKTV